jgi:hypothetical protein
MSSTRPVIDWFEIPVRDLDRAQRFYEQVLATTLRREPAGPGTTLAVIGHGEGPSAGCLMAGERAPEPASNGPLIYLNVEPSLDAALARATAAGGRITTPKVVLPDGMGCFAHVLDTEGNRVGLHAAA